jgi:long-chain fatty acid transport protein
MHPSSKRFVHLASAAALLGASLVAPRDARAGGFEMPDNGTEALGRGGAFVAKASDPTAIEYNPAGLAEQRGTRLLLDGKWTLSSYEFQRFGTFPDDPRDPATPWGGALFPKVRDTGGPFFAPFLAATTDFGTLDWLTVAAGVFGPSGVGNRTYPVGVAGAPAASRYDVVQPSSLIVLPTLAVGIKAADWLDLGLGAHYVYGSFALTSTSFVDLGDGPTGPCKNAEYQPCDSLSRVNAAGSSWAGTAGVLLHPSRTVSLGASVRTPISLDASGTATVLQAPLNQPIPAPGQATLHTELPWYARAGARLAFVDPDGFETGDVEVDGTYETWHEAQGTGPRIHIDHLGPVGPAFDDIDITVQHHYNDTFSIRAGGAYNQRMTVGVLSLRLGAYYDRSATADDPSYTRLDFDTLDKIAGTVGVGFAWNGFALNVAYAEVFEPGRTVEPGQGNVRPIDGAQHGAPVDSQGNPLPAVNEGTYSGHTEMIAVGLVAVFDEVLGSRRAKRWHDAGGQGGASPTPPAQKPAPPPGPQEPKDDGASAGDAHDGDEAPAPKPKKSDWDD